jgi:transcriptional regulator with XRE-family HTH domain
MKQNYELIREKRKGIGYSLAKMAGLCHYAGFTEIDESRLSRFERGEANMNQKQLAFLMFTLGIKPNDFFTEM